MNSKLDLLLAAEIGKSLLEHNTALKTDYDKLLQNVKNCELETQRAKSTVIYHEEHENNMRLISSKKAYDKIIESLESKNAEIQSMLDHTQQHAEQTDQAHLQRQRKLEAEIEALKANLDMAAQKVQELEENKQLQQERVRQLDEKKDYQQRQTEDLELLQELTMKMEEMCIENKHLQSSKRAVEEKLIVSLQDLERLRKEFERFELTNQGYTELHDAFERQTTHIRELNDSLEDHRLILSRLRDRGVWSPHHSTTPSVSGHQSIFSAYASKQSLLGELEHAWSNSNKLSKSQSETNLSSSKSALSEKLFDFASMTERNLTSFYHAPVDYAFDTLLSTVGIEDRSLFHEAEQFLSKAYSDYDEDLFEPEGNGTIYAEKDLYPKTKPILQPNQTVMVPANEVHKGLINRIIFHIRYAFRSIFRWCRFAIILTTAIFINLWKGPDLLLNKQYL